MPMCSASAIMLSYTPGLISMPNAMTTNVGPISLARNNERSMTRIRSPASALERPGSDAPLCGHHPLILKFGVSSKRKQPHESEFQPEPVKLHQSRIASCSGERKVSRTNTHVD